MSRHRDRGVLPLILAAALAAACADTSPLDIERTGTAAQLTTTLAGGASVTRSLRQQSSGLLQPVGPCAAGVEFIADGTGVATHIGRFSLHIGWCMNPTTGAITSGSATVTAASGDRIAMDLTGQAVSTTELSFNLGIIGGTGRFQNASGQLDVTALLGSAGGWTSEGAGWIRY